MPNGSLENLADEAMKSQLLIVLINRAGGEAWIPLGEIDGTSKYNLAMRLDAEGRGFYFEVREKGEPADTKPKTVRELLQDAGTPSNLQSRILNALCKEGVETLADLLIYLDARRGVGPKGRTVWVLRVYKLFILPNFGRKCVSAVEEAINGKWPPPSPPLANGDRMIGDLLDMERSQKGVLINALAKEGIFTARQLAAIDLPALLKVPNIGGKALARIEAAMAKWKGQQP